MTQGNRRLEGKVAIVTGAGSSGPGVGNGKAMATLFAREGAKVLLVDADLGRAEETLALITERGWRSLRLSGRRYQRRRLPPYGGGSYGAVRTPGHPG